MLTGLSAFNVSDALSLKLLSLAMAMSPRRVIEPRRAYHLCPQLKFPLQVQQLAVFLRSMVLCLASHDVLLRTTIRHPPLRSVGLHV